MSQLFNKKITVKGIESNLGKIVIVGGDGIRYSFFEKKQDGSESVAFQGFKSMNITVGSEIGITFSQKPNPKSPQYPFHNIVAIADPSSVEFNQDDGRPQYREEHPKKQKNDVDWDEVSRGKVRHAFLLEAYKQGKQLNGELLMTINSWVEVVMTGEMPDEIQVSDIDPNMPPL